MIYTIAEKTTQNGGLAKFELQSLVDNKIYNVREALVVPDFVNKDGEACLSHSVDVAHLDHFKGVKIPTVPQRDRIDVLIGQIDKELLAVLEERESVNPDDPNYVLTRLGPFASVTFLKRGGWKALLLRNDLS